MPRPTKPRRVGFIPSHKLFVPEGKNSINQEEIILKHDELEAMRLKDIENLNQEESAAIMNISRQTFQLIIDQARYKVAKSLVESRPLRIDGGHYEIRNCMKRCRKCGIVYDNNVQSEHFCRKNQKR